MSDKISVQQRKYFVERIQDSINEKINALKQTNAAEVQNISDSAFNKYLKLLKVDKDIKKFETIDTEHKKLQTKLKSVFEEVKKSILGDNNWESGSPSMYGTTSSYEMNEGFRWCCNKTAAKSVNDTPAGKIIKDLESKKRAAIDELHGVNELAGLKATVNNILKGANVPLLGE